MFKWVINLFKKSNTKTIHDNYDKIKVDNEERVTLEQVFDTSENAFESPSYISRKIDDIDLKTGENIRIYLEDKMTKLIKRNKLIILHGYTKQGKTVLIRKIFAHQPHIFLSGGTIASIESIWNEINVQLSIATSVQMKKGDQQSFSVESGKKVNLGPKEINMALHDKSVAKGGRTVDTTETFDLDPKASAAKILKLTHMTLIIDDFHFLPFDVQDQLIQFSRAVIGSCSVIFITTSSHVYDAVNSHDELKGRAEYVALPKWKKLDLEQIVISGFKKLKCNVDESMIKFIVDNSFYSPFLAQDICYELCDINKVIDNSKEIYLDMPKEKLLFLAEIAKKNYSQPYETILKITNQASKKYIVNNGEEMDIYALIREGIVLNNFFPSISVSKISDKIESLLEDPRSCKNIIGQTKQNLKIMYGESQKANKITEKTQQKKSEPPIEYIENRNGDLIVFHDPMLALYLLTKTNTHDL